MGEFTLRSYINLANADSAAKLPAPRFLHQVIATVTQGGRLAHDEQGAT